MFIEYHFIFSIYNYFNWIEIVLTYGSTSVSWAKKIVTSGGVINSASSVYSSDGSKIYTLLDAYNSGVVNLYFMTFLSSDGSVSGSRYKSNLNVNDMYGSTLNGDYLVTIALVSSTYYIAIINVSTYSFASKQYSGTVLNHIGFESYSGRWAYSFNL